MNEEETVEDMQATVYRLEEAAKDAFDDLADVLEVQVEEVRKVRDCWRPGLSVKEAARLLGGNNALDHVRARQSTITLVASCDRLCDAVNAANAANEHLLELEAEKEATAS